MRLVARFKDREYAVRFAQYLSNEKIDNTLEVDADVPTFEVWAVNEDRIDDALSYYEAFQKNPDDKRFHTTKVTIEKLEDEVAREEAEPPKRPRSLLFPGARGMGKVTLLLIVASAIIFLWGGIQVFQTSEGEKTDAFFVVSPIYAALLYDYPAAFKAYADLVKEYPPKEGQLSPEGVAALKQARQIPYWHGLYDEVLDYFKNSRDGWQPAGEMYEKIGEGEVWRLWTPVLLHGGILHIFFNVLWMLILSSQVESRLGWWRFSLFVLLAGILSNTSQYLMSGPLFFGLSGIVTALFGFIWMRQHVAPWEGYQLNKPTIWFLTVFILGMAVLQLIAFFFQLSGRSFFQLAGIANTAHIVGALSGALMGRFSLFAIRESA
jgi:rhomboid protease GlpG